MKKKEIVKLVIKNLKRKNLTKAELIKNLKLKKSDYYNLDLSLNFLINEKTIFKLKNKYCYINRKGLYICKIVKIFNTYAFAENEDERFYIRGKLLKGALLNDVCLLKKISSFNAKTKEAEVVLILEHSSDLISGTVKNIRDFLYFIPDYMPKFSFKIKKGLTSGAKNNDKVMVSVFKHADNHFDHIVKVEKIFGNSCDPISCCNSVLAELNIKRRFNKDTLNEAKEIYNNFSITEEDIYNRVDLRDENIFTIDSKESKDLDDAISIKKEKDNYILGVHIADVSHYVKHNSKIDIEAFERGTSVYYTNSVLPMLPKELSNGICSLNPNEDRLSFSCFITVNHQGDIVDYHLQKTVINSKVKGIYSEINKIFDNTAEYDIIEKYKFLSNDLNLLKELYLVIDKKNYNKGILDISSVESKFIFDEENNIIDIQKRSEGLSEKIIEYCMILANEAVATFSREKNLPFLYRVHEKPDREKLLYLKNMFLNMGIQNDISNTQLSILKVLSNTKNTDLEDFVHKNILRSMQKARYDTTFIGHFGLNLENYSHFTSPIRRYPDLLIHRILTEFIYENNSIDYINKHYKKFCNQAAKQSSQKELLSVMAERKCESIYKAYFMKRFLGETFSGIISSVTNFGIYVELNNTVEGLVKIENFFDGHFEFVDDFKYINLDDLSEYKIGTRVNVKLINVSVSLGNIDFELIKKEG